MMDISDIDFHMMVRKLAHIASLLLLLAACNRDNDKFYLSAPADVKAEQTGLGNIRLTWTNASVSYDGVVIERASQAGGWEFSELARVPKGVLVYDDNKHDGDAFYQYRLATYRRDKASTDTYVTFRYSRLPAPTDFKGEMTDEGYVLTWKDNCNGEDGYVIRKGFNGDPLEEWKVLGPDTETVTDPDVVSGLYEYEVCACLGDSQSAAATLKFDNTSIPQLKIGNVTASWHQVHVQFHLQDDGGFVCEGGVCWRTDGAKGANANDNCYTFPDKIRTGDPFFGSVQGLEPGKTYYLRPWVKYDGKYQYYKELTCSLMDEPEDIVPAWTDITRQYKMPSSIKLYKTETDINGRGVNAWYAVADMSDGDLELRTFESPAAAKPSDVAQSLDGVQVIVNGGFFSDGKSQSYIMDRGEEVNPGVRTVKCSYYNDEQNSVTRNYSVTRGAFGVNLQQEPSVKWLYTSREWAYDAPLPVFISGPIMQPTSTFPSYRQTWDVYSAIGGGPVILDNGHICIDYLTTRDRGDAKHYVGNPELIDDDVFGPTVRIARTAIGHTADGKIVIMVVNGTDGNDGVSLDELARMMRGVGCTDVLNLDGGDSSVMCVTPDARIINAPSAGVEREVFSFVALVAKYS